MDPDSQNFDSLRRLLALKRHEQPPPGYFNRFSRDVMARIKAGESGGEASFELPLFQRLFALFDVKPVFAGAFGMAMCALLISSVMATDKDNKQALSPSGPAVAEGSAMVNPDRNSVPHAPGSYFVSSTNGSLFDQIPAVQPKLAVDRQWIPNGN